ncbi:MAG TPA: hypothetical protein VK559_07135 [Ferruginibacter sp.]|nr:hypothetical protein [Ferruginibacter sp.]
MKVVLTDTQKKQLEKLWFIYGNGHKKHTLGNHRFIQRLLECNDDARKLFVNGNSVLNKLTSECQLEVDKILDNLKIGDKVSITTDAIDQGSQIPMNGWRGKIVAIEQNSYMVHGLGFRLPFTRNELTKL